MIIKHTHESIVLSTLSTKWKCVSKITRDHEYDGLNVTLATLTLLSICRVILLLLTQLLARNGRVVGLANPTAF